jgi:DNA-binding Xre family transcriptional regulator
MTGIVPSTMTKMQKNEYVSMDVLVRICSSLSCGISDVIEIHGGKAATEDVLKE